MANLLARLQQAKRSAGAPETLPASDSVSIQKKPAIKFVSKFFEPHAADRKVPPDILNKLSEELNNMNMHQINKSLPKLVQKHSIFAFAQRHQFDDMLVRGLSYIDWLTPTLIQDKIYSIPYTFNPELTHAVAFANLETWRMELHPAWHSLEFWAKWRRTMREHFLHEVAHFCSHLSGEPGHGYRWRTCMVSYGYMIRPCNAGAFFNQRNYIGWPEHKFMQELTEKRWVGARDNGQATDATDTE